MQDVLAGIDFRRAVKDAVVEIDLYHRIGRSDLRRDGQGLGLRRRELLAIVTEADVIVGDRRTFATEDNEQLRTQHSRVRREGALEMLPLAGEGWLIGPKLLPTTCPDSENSLHQMERSPFVPFAQTPTS